MTQNGGAARGRGWADCRVCPPRPPPPPSSTPVFPHSHGICCRIRGFRGCQPQPPDLHLCTQGLTMNACDHGPHLTEVVLQCSVHGFQVVLPRTSCPCNIRRTVSLQLLPCLTARTRIPVHTRCCWMLRCRAQNPSELRRIRPEICVGGGSGRSFILVVDLPGNLFWPLPANAAVVELINDLVAHSVRARPHKHTHARTHTRTHARTHTRRRLRAHTHTQTRRDRTRAAPGYISPSPRPCP